MDLRDKFSSISDRPQKILKVVISLAVILLSMWLITLSQLNYRPTDPAPLISRQDQADGTAAPAWRKELKAGKPSRSSSDFFANGLTTFCVLLVILGGIWFWMERRKNDAPRQEQRELSSQLLGEGAQLKIMRINDEVWVLGVTSSSVNLLHRYPREEWTETSSPVGETGDDTFMKFFKSKLG